MVANVKQVSELPPGSSGYDIDKEDREQILSTGVSIDEWFRNFRTPSETFAYPESVNALDWIETENQGQIGTCAGHGGTTVGEGVFALAAGGKAPTFSPWAHFWLAQKRDGIRGDNGATIAGCIWVGENIGYVPKSHCPPYPKSYRHGWVVTDEMREAAAPWKLKKHIDVRGYEASLRFLKNGQGFIHHGSRWTRAMDGPGDKIHDFHGPQRNDQHGGGHSVCIVGWSALLCPCCQKNYLIVHNSWTRQWGNDGAKYMCAKAYDDMSADRLTVLQGLSDIATPRGPRTLEIVGTDFA